MICSSEKYTTATNVWEPWLASWGASTVAFWRCQGRISARIPLAPAPPILILTMVTLLPSTCHPARPCI